MCTLVQQRNWLAKLQKISGEGRVQQLPPILDKEVCTNCYSRKICSIFSLSIEPPPEREPCFEAYRSMKATADKALLSYFKKWNEILQMEQNAHGKPGAVGAGRETNLTLQDIERIENGVIVVLGKQCASAKSLEIQEGASVILTTKKSISFSKGYVVKRAIKKKELNEEEKQRLKEEREAAELCGEASKALNGKKEFLLEFRVEFSPLNPMNFEKTALGGLDCRELEWTLEVDTLS